MTWFESLQDHWWLLALAVLVSLGTLAVLPLVVLALPEDYFVTPRRRPLVREAWPPWVRPVVLVLKNLLGVLLLVLGVLMLVLPGQGLLTLLCGLVLLDFPGKYRCLRWLAGREKILASLNWLRTKRGLAPLQKPDGGT
ncbi:MAG TPA: PGPGW domain-containing protein [Hyphomicrobiales bacterium]|nr:PGPGW domain-containing protein [Hyphomicrobiales bacterium]